MKSKFYITIILLLVSLSIYAGRIKLGMNALEVYDYFKAKKNFEKAQNRHPVASAYGLSVIYLRKDNPFYNLDSAQTNIEFAFENYNLLTIKRKLKYSKVGMNSVSIVNQRNRVINTLFLQAKQINTEDGYQRFITNYPESVYTNRSKYSRDSIVYQTIVKNNKSAQFMHFMQKYPKSEFFQKSKLKYERLLYIEETNKIDVKSFISFIANYPNSSFVTDAEDRIYELETNPKTIESYELFINTYPDNRNISQAWQELYNSFLLENSFERAISDFIKRYPNTPHIATVENELELAKSTFYRVKENDLWYFVSENGKNDINEGFEHISDFKEGLAAVTINGLIGYIDKSGHLKIPCQFIDGYDFEQGYAVVETNKGYGLINRIGEFVVEPIYGDLGILSNGLIPYALNDFYGYFNKRGEEKIASQYEDAYSFELGTAKVKKDGKWGVINEKGYYVLYPDYQQILNLTDTSYALKLGDKWGGMTVSNDTIVPFVFDYIGKPSLDVYLVAKNDSFNYWAGSKLILAEWEPIYSGYKTLAKYKNQPILVYGSKGYNYKKIDGTTVFKYEKESLGPYDNLIPFSQDGLWGYLSVDPVAEVIAPKFDFAMSYINNTAIVGLNNKYGIIDTLGNEVIKIVYDDISVFNDSLFLIKENGKYGLMTINQKMVIPFIANKIELYKDANVSVYIGKDLKYFNLLKKNWITKAKN